VVAQLEVVALVLARWVKQSVARLSRVFVSPIGVPMATRPDLLLLTMDQLLRQTNGIARAVAFPAGRDKANPPKPVKNEPYKTHLAYVKERRSATEGAAILEEALKKLRGELD